MIRVLTRRLITGCVMAAVLSGSGVVAASPAAAASPVGTVAAKGGALKIRTGPNVSAKVIGLLRDKTKVKLPCYVKGEYIRGGVRSTNVWHRLAEGRYISHAYVRATGSLRSCSSIKKASPVKRAPAKPTPSAATYTVGTVASGDGPVNLRQGPTTATPVRGKVAGGARISISCAVAGAFVHGWVRSTNQWDRLRDGRYISHAYVTSNSVPLCAGSTVPTTQVPQTNAEFIAMAVPGAQRGWRDYGVPPSVTIAQSILESGWGRSGLAANDRNFFGIKCFDGDPGGIAAACRTYQTTECTKAGSCFSTSASFRSYRTAADSFRDHGHFLRVNSRYKGAFKHSRDANKFLWAVWKAGYATDPNYYKKVTNLMAAYDLYKYDTWL